MAFEAARARRQWTRTLTEAAKAARNGHPVDSLRLLGEAWSLRTQVDAEHIRAFAETALSCSEMTAEPERSRYLDLAMQAGSAGAAVLKAGTQMRQARFFDAWRTVEEFRAVQQGGDLPPALWASPAPEWDRLVKQLTSSPVPRASSIASRLQTVDQPDIRYRPYFQAQIAESLDHELAGVDGEHLEATVTVSVAREEGDRFGLYVMVTMIPPGSTILPRDSVVEPMRLELGPWTECLDAAQNLMGSPGALVTAVADTAGLLPPETTLADLQRLDRQGVLKVYADEVHAPGQAIDRASSGASDGLSYWRSMGNDLEYLLSHPTLRAPTAEALRLFLREAPLTSGTWGPFKSLLKSLLDRPDMPAEAGLAIARVTCAGRQNSPAGGFPSAPSAATLHYLDRRARRVLHQLANRDPQAYATLCLNYLQAVDAGMSQGRELNRRAVFDFILFGRSDPAYPGVRFPSAAGPVSQEEERRDVRPDVWDVHADDVRNLLAKLRNSPEIADWCFQVLSDTDTSVPHVSPDVALRSGIPHLRDLGLRALQDDPRLCVELGSRTVTEALIRDPRAETFRLLDACQPETKDAAIRSVLQKTGRRKVLSLWLRLRIAQLGVDHWLADLGDEQARQALRLLIDADPMVDRSEALVTLAPSFTVATYRSWCARNVEPPAIWLQSAAADAAIRSGASIYGAEGSAWQLVSSSEPGVPALGWLVAVRLSGNGGHLGYFLNYVSPNARGVVGLLSVLIRHSLIVEIATAIGWGAGSLPNDEWGETTEAASIALESHPHTATSLYMSEDFEQKPVLRERLMQIPAFVAALTADVHADQIGDLDDTRLELLEAALRKYPDRLRTDAGLSLAVATSRSSALRSVAMDGLRQNPLIPQIWLGLIESGLPECVDKGVFYLRSIDDPVTAKNAYLALLDSPVAWVRSFGMSAVSGESAPVGWKDLLPELTEHRDPIIWSHVAARADDSLSSSERKLFNELVLNTRRRGRTAKLLIQDHLHAEGTEASDQPGIDVLLSLTGSPSPRDREWAIEQLTARAEAGDEVPGLQLLPEDE